MKKTCLLLLSLTSLFLTSCATFQTASVADYNGDGVISDAEYKQYQKQKSVEAANVEVETMKRRNAVNTVGDANETLWNIHGIRNSIRAF
jgi:hypothetical protein